MRGTAWVTVLAAWLVGSACGSVATDDAAGEAGAEADDGAPESDTARDGEVGPDSPEVRDDAPVDAAPDVAEAVDGPVPADASETVAEADDVPPPTCPLGQVDCDPDPTGLNCVDLDTDPSNCGTCGQACGDPSAVCEGGSCLCPDSFTDCEPGPGALCVHDAWFPWDLRHCGGCGRACQPGQHCYEGECRCIWLLANCGGSCTDPDSNPRYCGGCTAEHQCTATTPYCNAGVCSLDCTPSSAVARCDYACALTDRDPLNCGGCGIRCRADQLCLGGNCVNYTVRHDCTVCPCLCPTGTICCPFPRWGAPELPLICVEGSVCPSKY